MTELTEAASTQAPLSETQRCVDVFTVPTKTFTDIRRKATFWGPLIVMIIVGIGFSFTVQQKIGWQQVFQNDINQTPAQMEKIESNPKAAQIKAFYPKVYAGQSYGFFAIVLLITLLAALLLWASINFGLGGKAKYSEIYAVILYSGLVMNIKSLLGIVAIFAGLAPESFLIKNPVGSNIGYYLSSDSPLWLRTLCARFDVFEIWALILTIIGVSVVAKVSKGKSAVVVVGWWIIFILFGTAMAGIAG